MDKTENKLLASKNNCVYNGKGFSGGSDAKESACSAGDLGLIPGSGRCPEEGNGYPLQYYCLKNFVDRGAWWATWGHKELGMAEWLTLSFFTVWLAESSPEDFSKMLTLSLLFQRKM